MPDLSVDTASVGNHGILHQGIAAYPVSGHAAVSAVNLPVFIKEIDAAVLRVQDLHVGLPEGGDGPYVLPVSVEVISIHPSSVTQQVGNDVVAKVIFRVRVSLILYEILSEDVPVEYVDAHGSQVGLWILWLFLEFGDAVIPVSHHESEAGRVLPRYLHDSHAEFGSLFLVEFKKVAVVLFANLVS